MPLGVGDTILDGLEKNMEQLIKALQILMKYDNPRYPTCCGHDVLTVLVDPALVSQEDGERLAALGFFANEEDGCFESFRYGSA